MIKSIWKDPVWSKVIATGILALVASFGTYLVGAWPVIGKWLNHAWSFLNSSTPVQNWLIGLMAIPSALLIFAVAAEIKDKLTPSKDTLTYKDYTRDNFLGLLWSWKYSGGEIVSLHSLCPRCEYQILPRDVRSYDSVGRFEYACDDCGYSAGTVEEFPEEMEQKIRLKIQKALRTGKWAEKNA